MQIKNAVFGGVFFMRSNAFCMKCKNKALNANKTYPMEVACFRRFF
jgi:hypothetical protein